MNLLTSLERFQDAVNEKSLRLGSSRVTRLPEKARVGPRSIPGGSIAVFVAAKGAGVLRTVSRALNAREHRTIDSLVRKHAANLVKHSFEGRSSFRSYREVPVFGEIRYGSKALAHGFFLDRNRDLAFALLPYNGGKLRTEQFRFAEYYTPGSTERLECLVVIRPPILTPLEKEMLSRVPADLSEMNIGQSNLGFAIIAATLGVLAVAATIYVTYKVYQEMQREREAQAQQEASAEAEGGGGGEEPTPTPTPCTPTPEPELRELDPSAAARLLLQRRARMMTRF